MPLSVSLLVTTYNWPLALAACLKSIKIQTRLPDEIIICDDGSTSETALLIKKMQPEFEQIGVPLIHKWQEDLGFRLARSRNMGIAIASGDYIVTIDQDVVMDKHFIADHIKAASPGRMVAGRRIKLNNAQSQMVINDQWMPSPFRGGLSLELSFKAMRNSILSSIISKSTYTALGTLGCNMAFWRADALAINGFNAEFVGWGTEDYEFYQRLVHFNGTKRYVLRHAATAYHLYHKEAVRDAIPANIRIVDEIVKDKIVYCRLGVNEFTDNDHHIPNNSSNLLYLKRRNAEATCSTSVL
ncbi:glycosyltransferase family 2 protein [Shewanella sp. C32]|uniref:Glycosyltransferase family 2 protein n=1 Tax=Shewanella electrica TaxID=515560 RepID=A0ABT2FLW8_9GAMM|nr:glycosyltransferase family 2 protein [Shewanella electrica]MCH1925783.1 glycosyltransferase family 2 protein [Shewanella electrica]MCS4557332.1 glycosyltransferase family 2 protein [Shewanella electrica]